MGPGTTAGRCRRGAARSARSLARSFPGSREGRYSSLQARAGVAGRKAERDASVQYQSDYILRIIEQMGVALREAFARFSGGADPEESLELTEQAIGLVVDMDPRLFLRFSPQSMVSFVEISGFDDRVVGMLVEALELEADILDTQGNIVESRVRREQARALKDALNPANAN